jgi:hypothetical protein
VKTSGGFVHCPLALKLATKKFNKGIYAMLSLFIASMSARYLASSHGKPKTMEKNSL